MATIIDSIRNLLVPIHREGYVFIAIAAAAFLLLWMLDSSLAWIALVLTLWVTFFFRDPPRVTPQEAGLVVAPADGRVSSVADAVPPPELGLGTLPMARVSIFMNVFDCHINRAPVAGTVRRIAYRPGTFVNAELDKASDDNERNGLIIETAGGVRFGVVQIAGLVARRIVCFVSEGENVAAGDRFGLIRFGSRLDVYMPAGTRPLVAEGQRAVGGETVIADLSRPQPERLYRAG